MKEASLTKQSKKWFSWWRTLGPAIITASVVLGPGSLLVNSNIGAVYGHQLLWLLVFTAVCMGTYIIMAVRIGIAGGATPCTLIAQRLGRPFAAVIGINLFLICTTFQFGNNLAFAAAARSLIPGIDSFWVLLALNLLIIFFVITTTKIYKAIERIMKFMVALILICFLINLVIAAPSLLAILKGLVPNIPQGLSLGVPKKVDGRIFDPMILIASLLGTTFSAGAAFYQGNLVREKGWTLKDHKRGISDAVVGVSILAVISAILMMTTATVIRGQSVSDIGTLAQSLRPLLGATAHIIFCVGLLAVSLNPFLINSMIGGSILADGIGQKAKLSDKWPRRFTVIVLLVGMTVAVLALRTGEKPINLIIFGQALTVLGNPLMAATLLWLANRKDIMGNLRNKIVLNIFGSIGLLVVVLMAVRVLYRLILQLS